MTGRRSATCPNEIGVIANSIVDFAKTDGDGHQELAWRGRH